MTGVGLGIDGTIELSQGVGGVRRSWKWYGGLKGRGQDVPPQVRGLEGYCGSGMVE